MAVNTKSLDDDVKAIFNMRKFEDTINLLTDEVLEREKDADLYYQDYIVCYMYSL